MRRKTKIIIGSPIVIAVLALIYWQNNTPSTMNQSTIATPQSDYYFKNIKIRQFNSEGNLENQLNAQLMEHFASKNLSIMETANIIFYPQEKTNNAQQLTQNTWQVSAAKGEFDHLRNQLTLDKKIIMREIVQTQPPQKSQPEISIDTSHLNVDLNRQIAENQVAVTIKNEHSLTSAIGMQIDFKRSQLKLKSQVSGEIYTND
ncbi:LPS export ABC transporter periplasmic protein LptC [Aliikangiella maris]|uniref:LPS export ABC transporter periplasmic protein LptC n=2 Tax=Aliikangiella maris TaxID=3162458 RepID=A0ABV3MQN7_9GAMM